MNVKKLNLQYGGAIPFSALKSKSKKKTKRSSKNRSTKKRKKRTISPSREHRKVTKKTKRSKKKTVQKKVKTCNCGTHKYTGTEDSPNGLGKCSECIPLNVVMKGKDNYLYENTSSGWVKINF